MSNIGSGQVGSRLKRYLAGSDIAPARSPLFYLEKLEKEAQCLALRREGEEARAREAKDREANSQVETDRPQLEAIALSMERATREAADKALQEQVGSLRQEREAKEAQLDARIDAFDKALASPRDEAKNEEALSSAKVEGLERDVQSLRERLEQLSSSAEVQGQEITRLRKGKDKEIGEEQEQDMERRETAAKKMKQQQLAIMHLSYRHIMEGLPPPKPPVPKPASKTANSKSKRSKPQQGTGHKQAWTDFWSAAYKEAKDGKAGPVKDLLDGLPGSISHNQILEDGKNLYGIYSANIHGFGGYHGRDVYDVEEGTISNLTERVILEALKPLDDHVGDDGRIDWVAERARFHVV